MSGPPAPGMAQFWNSAASWGNAAFIGTGVVLAGVPAVAEAAVAAPAIATSVLYGPATNRVFWSGAGYFGARAYASMTGGSTLEMTPVGSTLEFLGERGIPWSIMQPLWASASRVFAGGAQGPVLMFQGLNGYTGNIWNTVESIVLTGRFTYIPF